VVAVEPTSGRRSALDAVAGSLLALESVVLAVVTVLYGSYAALDQGGQRFLWGATAVSGIFTAGVVAVTWGFWTRKRFAHGGAFAVQLLMGAAGVWLLGTIAWLGAALIAGAVVIVIAVMKRVAALPTPQGED
jgi:hypothetical protein